MRLKSLFSRFQSTLPREERQLLYCLIYLCPIFQSTLPREERLKQITLTSLMCLFQSTLPREERRTALHNIWLFRIFQSTLPREERLYRILYRFFCQNFNPRSHERSDSNIAQKICLFLYNTDNKYIIR